MGTAGSILKQKPGRVIRPGFFVSGAGQRIPAGQPRRPDDQRNRYSSVGKERGGTLREWRRSQPAAPFCTANEAPHQERSRHCPAEGMVCPRLRPSPVHEANERASHTARGAWHSSYTIKRTKLRHMRDLPTAVRQRQKMRECQESKANKSLKLLGRSILGLYKATGRHLLPFYLSLTKPYSIDTLRRLRYTLRHGFLAQH